MRRSISFFGGESRLIEEQRRRKEKKTVMLLVWVVIVFILAWLPLNSLSVLLDLDLYKTIFRYNEHFECLWSTYTFGTTLELDTEEILYMFSNIIMHRKQIGCWYVCMCVSSVSYPEGDDSLFRAWFCLCHITSLLSALANPILYGYFNEVCVNLKDSAWCNDSISRGSDENFVSWLIKDVVEYQNQQLVKNLVLVIFTNVLLLEMSEMSKSCDMCLITIILV